MDEKRPVTTIIFSGCTRPVVAQRIEHATFLNGRMAAHVEQPFERRLEGFEIGDFFPDLGEMLDRDPVDFAARGAIGALRNGEQAPHRVERKTEFARFANEGEPLAMGLAVNAMAACAPVGVGEKADLLIVTDRNDPAAGKPSEFTDGEIAAHKVLEPIVAIGLISPRSPIANRLDMTMKECCGDTGTAQEPPIKNGGCRAENRPEPAVLDRCCASASEGRIATAPYDAAASKVIAAAPQVPARHVAGDDCCSAKEDEIAALGAYADVRRVLQIVLIINLAMFFAEFAAGIFARSTALMADSIDMLGDALVYILSLYALERSLRWRAGAALFKGGIIAAFGIWVAVEVALKLAAGVVPMAGTMGIFGFIALAANLTCLALLYRHRNRDVNLSSTFECSRNDVIANTGVIVAAAGVYMFNSGWPDIIVGSAIAILFFRSAVRVLRQAWPQFRAARPVVSVALD